MTLPPGNEPAGRNPETVSSAPEIRNLLGLSREELEAEITALGEAPFRARQLWNWLYCQGARDFSDMSNLSKALREKLESHFTLSRPQATESLLSIDETRKWLLAFDDGSQAETVYIPEEDRGSLCVSSQVGCTLTCSFCHTGTQRLVRNLTAGEIVGQFMLAKDALQDWPASKPDRRLTNIVMMGMGEPLFNYEEVAKALTIVMDPDGIALSRRRITLSTSGIVPMIERCGEELAVNLAISLHAVHDELRNELVPINKKYPIAELLEACRNYPVASNARRITFEYVMLKDINDSMADARELVRLLKGIPAKINLIPFNPWPGAPYECSTEESIRRFAEYINDAGYASPVRTPRGQDIMAACGQLKTASERKRKSLN